MATTAAELVGTTGAWTFGTPERVTISGRSFRRARWRAYRVGVVDQYREEVPAGSLHLLVLADGSYRIDHRDDFNPDGADGSPLRHLVSDFIPSRAGIMVLGGLVVAGVALVALYDEA